MRVADRADDDVVLVPQERHLVAGLDAQLLPQLLGDDHLPFRSDDVSHTVEYNCRQSPRRLDPYVGPLDITTAHAEHAPKLPKHHCDPFDRMLVAQAQLEALVLVTADRVLGRYEVELIDARS